MGTRSSLGKPASSDLFGGYHDNTKTPKEIHKRKFNYFQFITVQEMKYRDKRMK